MLSNIGVLDKGGYIGKKAKYSSQKNDAQTTVKKMEGILNVHIRSQMYRRTPTKMRQEYIIKIELASLFSLPHVTVYKNIVYILLVCVPKDIVILLYYFFLSCNHNIKILSVSNENANCRRLRES